MSTGLAAFAGAGAGYLATSAQSAAPTYAPTGYAQPPYGEPAQPAPEQPRQDEPRPPFGG